MCDAGTGVPGSAVPGDAAPTPGSLGAAESGGIWTLPAGLFGLSAPTN
jgi:hypothetical protein